MHQPTITHYIEIDEDEILEASRVAEAEGHEELDNFRRLLSVGHTFKMSGLTPIYLFDKTEGTIMVTTEEKQNNMLN